MVSYGKEGAGLMKEAPSPPSSHIRSTLVLLGSGLGSACHGNIFPFPSLGTDCKPEDGAAPVL